MVLRYKDGMQRASYLWVLVAFLIVLALGIVIGRREGMKTATTSPSATPFADGTLEVYSPLPGSAVSSPLTVRGRVKGTWYFEASFPVILVGADGRTIAQGPARALSDWMTADWVPFEITLDFSKPSVSQGFLILKKDNPSDLPQNDDSRQIPVSF